MREISIRLPDELLEDLDSNPYIGERSKLSACKFYILQIVSICIEGIALSQEDQSLVV